MDTQVLLIRQVRLTLDKLWNSINTGRFRKCRVSEPNRSRVGQGPNPLATRKSANSTIPYVLGR